MKNTIVLTLVALVSSGCTIAQNLVSNPVWPENFPDPTVWKGDDGIYYSAATNVNKLLKSVDLMNWTDTGRAPVSFDDVARMHVIAERFWAPDVVVVNSCRLMYLTLYNSAQDSNIAVLKEIKDGEFSYEGVITSGKNTGIEDTIDPEIVTDPVTGKVWMFFGSVGGIYRVELTSDGMRVAPGACYTHVAGVTIHEDSTRTKVFEGSYLHRHGEYWYLFVSGGFFGDHTYKLMVGRSRSLTGVFKDRAGREMRLGFATDVLSSDRGDFFYGPGHCGEIHQSSDGREFIFYHCHTLNMKPAQRAMLMQEILWDEQGWPYCIGGKPSKSVGY